MSDERTERNQVFSNVEGQMTSRVNPGVQVMSAAEKVKADFGLEVPIEVVPLPSAGRVYPTDSSLFNRETVEIKAMTAREEDILTSPAYLKKGTVISELIKSCLIDKSINPIDMLSGDRNALMVAIRITGYTADYDVEVDCNSCGNKTTRTFNLAELPIRRLAIEPVREGMNLFEFKLPRCGKIVCFKFLTGRDEEEIVATQTKQKKLGIQGDTTVTTNLLYAIVSVDGDENRTKIANFVRNMPASDSLALRNYIRDNEPGMIMRQDVSCPTCGEAEEVAMPLGVTFLWPGAQR